MELNKWDYIIFGSITLFCYFASNQGTDIFVTAGASKYILNGHLFDFYSYSYSFNYMPSTYLLFAVWGLPLKILGLINGDISLSYGELMWYKACPTLFYAASALLIYKIGKYIGFDNQKSKLAAFIFISAPIGFFSQFIFGQYDIFTVFFIILGLYFYFKNDMLKFSLSFGAAVTFKYHALLFFIVLLLLKEKSIKKIVKYCAIAGVLFFLETVLFIRNEGYVNGVFGFAATGYVKYTQLLIGAYSIQLVLFIFIFICAFAYFKKTTDQRSFVSQALFLCNAVVFILFGLSMFHPQWLLIAVPFLTLSTCINKNYKTFLLLDILMMIIFCILTVNLFPDNVDESMFAYGFLQFLGFNIDKVVFKIKDLYIYRDRNVLYTILSGILFLNVIFKDPRFCAQEIGSSITDCTLEMRARFITGIGFFVIPSLACVFMAINSPIIKISQMREGTPVGYITASQNVEQSFFSDNMDTIKKFSVKFATYARVNSCTVTVSFLDSDKKEIQKWELNAQDIQDNTVYDFTLDEPYKEAANNTYWIKITSDSTDDNNAVTLWCSNFDNYKLGTLFIAGVPQEGDLYFQILGEMITK